MPFYARPDATGGYSVNCTQNDVAAEIGYAQKAGLDFFAFVMYSPNTALGAALQWFRTLSNTGAHRMSWCMILESSDFIPGHAGNAGPPSLWLQYVQDFNYMKVGTQNQPLIFIFGISSIAPSGKAVFDSFSADVEKVLGVQPYWVGMAWSPFEANKTLPVSGVSVYATFAGRNGEPYAALASAEESMWTEQAKTGLSVIPTVTPRMDPRPMYELPNGTYNSCPWCNCYRPPCRQGGGCSSGRCSPTPHWAMPPNAGEVAAHSTAMLRFLKNNKDNGIAQLQLGLVGAWNENVEGHYCVPTWTESGVANTSILDEIASAIHQFKHNI